MRRSLSVESVQRGRSAESVRRGRSVENVQSGRNAVSVLIRASVRTGENVLNTGGRGAGEVRGRRARSTLLLMARVRQPAVRIPEKERARRGSTSVIVRTIHRMRPLRNPAMKRMVSDGA